MRFLDCSRATTCSNRSSRATRRPPTRKPGVPPAPHKTIASLDDIDGIEDELLPGILKTVRMGYDGKGQVRVNTREDIRAAFEAMQGVTCLLEKMLPLAYEVSVLTARGFDGASVV